MKYLIPGFIAGALLSLLIFQGGAASELHTGFYLSFSDIENAAMPQEQSVSASDFYVVPYNNAVYLLNSYGTIAKRIETGDLLAEFSSNGRYYIPYGKVGTSIELSGFNGERYWKKNTREKPLLSHNGKIILLLVGDHSRLRIFDKDGNQTGAGSISGRLCTSITFSDANDFSCFGFADGTYYFLDEKGGILGKGALSQGNIVKGIRVSSNGKFGAVHYGNEQKDMIRVITLPKNSYDETDLANVHVMKTAINVSDTGVTSILDIDNLLVLDDDADEVFRVKIPAKRAGQASIKQSGDYFFVVYTRATGESQLYVFNSRGGLFYSREFAGESYLDAAVRDGSVIVRGSDSLFSYRIHVPGN